MRRLLLALCWLPALACADTAGERIYLQGLLPDGSPLTARVHGDVGVTGARAACVSCHRRSGLGASEGSILVPPITREALGAPRYPVRPELQRPRADNRPPYDAARLARALREGIDSAGNPLDPLMPRYQMTDREMNALLAWLGRLSGKSAPGVDPGTIHFATIIAPDRPEAEARTMLALMERYVADKNATTRAEPRRARHPPWHRDLEYPSWRRWMLHRWELTGPPESWPSQLDEHYRQQPVFAVIGGLADDWRPIHGFCEERRLPCLFPHTRQPGSGGWYNVYFSAGEELERQAAAGHLAAQPIDPAAAATPLVTPEAGDVVVDGTVLFLPAPQPLPPGMPARVYLGSPWRGHETAMPASWRARTFRVEPYRRPVLHPRLTRWLDSRGLAPDAPLVQADTFTALTLTGEALMHLQDFFSREYLIEKIEHVANRLVVPPAWQSFTLAPGQRRAVKGAAVVPLAGGETVWVATGSE